MIEPVNSVEETRDTIKFVQNSAEEWYCAFLYIIWT